MTGAYVAYLTITFPHWQRRNLKVQAYLDYLCPFAFLTAIYMDTPCATTLDYDVLWTIIAILNAGLYGAVGAALIKLGRALRGKFRTTNNEFH